MTSFQNEAVPRSVEEPKAKEVPEEDESEGTKDTTGQHKAHLFDLNCKICTGKRKGERSPAVWQHDLRRLYSGASVGSVCSRG